MSKLLSGDNEPIVYKGLQFDDNTYQCSVFIYVHNIFREEKNICRKRIYV